MQNRLLRYPLDGPGGVETLLIGGGLHLLAVYLPVVPHVLVLGYLLAVVVHTASDQDAGEHGAPQFVTLPPTRTQARRLLTDGVRGSVVTAVYLAVPAAILLVTVQGVGGLSELTPASGAAVTVGGTAALVSAAVFCYPLPAALSNVGRRRSVRAGFDTTILRRGALDARYFVGWATGIGALAVGLAVAEPLFPYGVGFFLLFYAEVVAAAQWGWGISLVLE
jgi:hypothetical protein